MAVFSKKSVLLVLAILLLASIALRYPLVEHERQQTDSYYIHLLSRSISEDDRAAWTFHPLSYFGYYPYSYPTGIPFLFAELSSLTGLSVDVTILVCNMIFALLFCLGAFLLARQFISRPEFALLAAFFTVLGARFVDTTYWDGSARGPLVVLMLLVVFVSYRASSARQNKLVGIALLLGAGCFAIHHMAVLLILFGLGYALAFIQSQYLLPRVRVQRTAMAIAFNSLIATIVLVVAFGIFEFFGKLALMNLQKSALFDVDPPFLSVLLNMAVSYTNQIGFILVFAVLSVPLIFRGPRITTESIFMVTLFLVFIPLLGDMLYVSMLLAPFASIMGAKWFIDSFSKKKKNFLVLSVLVVLMASSILLPVWSTQRWNSREYLSGDTVEVGNDVFNDASYLGFYYEDEFAVSNVNALTSVMSAYTDVHFMAPGIPSALSGDVNRSELQENITQSKSPFPMNLYAWYEHNEERYVEYFRWALMVGGARHATSDSISPVYREYFSTHQKMIVVIDNSWRDQYIDVYVISAAIFPLEVRSAELQASSQTSVECEPLPSYVLYQSERTSLFAVELPI